jgi:hypothetical protein
MTRPDRALEAEVVDRAQGRCEYCHFPEEAAELPFHTDHIIAKNTAGIPRRRTLHGPASRAIYAKDRT